MKTFLLVGIVAALCLFLVKDRKVIFAFFSIWIFLMMCFSVNNPDYFIYKEIYTGVRTVRFTESVGFLALMRGFNELGVKNYFIFVACLSFFAIFVFGLWYSLTTNIVYSMYVYMLFVLYYDIVQIRFGIACITIIMSLFFMIKNKPAWMVLFSALLAGTIHWASFVGVIYILFLYWHERRYGKSYEFIKKNMVIVLLVTATVGVLGKVLGNFIMPNWGRVSCYLRNETSWSSMMIWTVCMVSQLLALWFWAVRDILKNNNCCVSAEKKRTIYLLFTFSLLFVIFLPCASYIEEIGRLFRIPMLVMAILYALVKDEISNQRQKLLFGVIVAINCGLMFGWIYRGANPDMWWCFV